MESSGDDDDEKDMSQAEGDDEGDDDADVEELDEETVVQSQLEVLRGVCVQVEGNICAGKTEVAEVRAEAPEVKCTRPYTTCKRLTLCCFVLTGPLPAPWWLHPVLVVWQTSPSASHAHHHASRFNSFFHHRRTYRRRRVGL